MESLGIVDPNFWKGRRVFVTGHSGFKGAWLTLWLTKMGASVFGLSLPPDGDPNLYSSAQVNKGIQETFGDIRNADFVSTTLNGFNPEVVFHLAAQALVRTSYQNPVDTFATNVMGTVNVLDAVRRSQTVKCVVSITSDKCYENREWPLAYRENDPMGGRDPYSASKGCAELATSCFRRSFFANASRPVGLASARAGNVIGGGDWSADRLIPDCVRAFSREEPVVIRNPRSTRPWQHVLDALRGYLLLAQCLYVDPLRYSEGWNFGPQASGVRPVGDVVTQACSIWGGGTRWVSPDISPNEPVAHEACSLLLDSSLAQCRLKWRPLLPFDAALKWSLSWYQQVMNGKPARDEVLAQLNEFDNLEEHEYAS